MSVRVSPVLTFHYTPEMLPEILFWAPDSRLNPAGKLKPSSWEVEWRGADQPLDHFTQRRDRRLFLVFPSHESSSGAQPLSLTAFTPKNALFLETFSRLLWVGDKISFDKSTVKHCFCGNCLCIQGDLKGKKIFFSLKLQATLQLDIRGFGQFETIT